MLSSSDHHAMMPVIPSSSSSDVAIERVEMLKQQRKNDSAAAAGFVFDIADSAAPAIEIVQQQPSGDELSSSSFSSNEFVEDVASTTSAPDVVVQSSIKDAMALIQAEEREAKIASGEIVGAYPFSFFFSSILSRSRFAAQTVDCDLGYTLGAPQSTL
jgi:beta-lactam-binding protein with PASTA domain